MADENILKTGGKMIDGFWTELNKFASNLLASFIIFILSIVVFGQLYAYYFMQQGNELMLWLPTILLIVVLFYRVLE